MKQKILLFALAILGICWSSTTMAQLAQQEKCIDSDGSLAHANHNDYFLPGVTKGNVRIMAGRNAGVAATRRDSCGADGKLIEYSCSADGSNFISGRRINCRRFGGDYVCQNGRCARPQEEVTLNDCRLLESNTHYVITEPLLVSPDGRPCFSFRRGTSLTTVECRGNGSIRSATGGTAFAVVDGSFFNLLNCRIENFRSPLGLNFENSNIRILGNTFIGPENPAISGGFIWAGEMDNLIFGANVIRNYNRGLTLMGRFSATISDNSICDSEGASFSCTEGEEGSSVQGSGNRFHAIDPGCDSFFLHDHPYFFQLCP